MRLKGVRQICDKQARQVVKVSVIAVSVFVDCKM